MYVVYMHKTPSNKVYIGITSQKPEKRWNEGLSYNKYFTNAIIKYGWDNIEHIIMAENLSKEDACKMEQELISKYKSTDSKFGYNITIGGNVGCLGYRHTDDTKHQMSLDRQGKKLIRRKKNYKPWNLGTHLTDSQKENLRQHRLGTTQSDETRQKISNAIKGRTYTDEYKYKVSVRQTGCNNSFYGKSHSEKTRKRISENTSNRIWINDGYRCKRVKLEELQLFLDTGWVKGRIK